MRILFMLVRQAGMVVDQHAAPGPRCMAAAAKDHPVDREATIAGIRLQERVDVIMRCAAAAAAITAANDTAAGILALLLLLLLLPAGWVEPWFPEHDKFVCIYKG